MNDASRIRSCLRQLRQRLRSPVDALTERWLSRLCPLAKREGEDKEPVDTWVPWAGQDPPAEGHHEPSSLWPIQKLMWSDFAVRSRDKVSYQAVPMTGSAGSLEPREDLATPWSHPVSVGPAAEAHLSAWFNRGVLATQSLPTRLAQSEEPWTEQRETIIARPDDPVRNYLSGTAPRQREVSFWLRTPSPNNQSGNDGR
jgi:hypothetical protein